LPADEPDLPKGKMSNHPAVNPQMVASADTDQRKTSQTAKCLCIHENQNLNINLSKRSSAGKSDKPAIVKHFAS
jgi:hypothetical protein